MALVDWTYVHSDTGGATVSSTLNGSIELEGVTSLVHQVDAGSPAAVDTIDIMGWGAGITDNTTLVRTCFKFLQSMYGVFAIMQTSLGTASQCYAATYDSSGNITLWKATIAQILANSVSPIQTIVGAVPSSDTWGISLLTQYDVANNLMQLTVATTDSALTLPIVEGVGLFPATSARIIYIDPSPLTSGVNAGIFSSQAGNFAALTNLDDFDVTQIFTT